MICPKCGFPLFEKNSRTSAVGTFFEIKCTNEKCDYFDYKTLTDEDAKTLKRDLNNVKEKI